MTVAQVWFAIWTTICLFFQQSVCKKHKKCLLYLKNKSFFNIEDTYNIIQMLQYKINLAMQILLLPDHHSAFYILLFAGLQDTILAVISRVLSWCVSQSYLVLDVFFFLSLKKNSYFYLHALDELLGHVGWVYMISVLQRIKSSSTMCTVVCRHYNQWSHILCTIVKCMQFRFFSLLYLPSQLRHCILYRKTWTF